MNLTKEQTKKLLNNAFGFAGEVGELYSCHSSLQTESTFDLVDSNGNVTKCSYEGTKGEGPTVTFQTTTGLQLELVTLTPEPVADLL